MKIGSCQMPQSYDFNSRHLVWRGSFKYFFYLVHLTGEIIYDKTKVQKLNSQQIAFDIAKFVG